MTQFSGHKHATEDSDAQLYIKSKVQHALENMESLIKHVEVRLREQEHFHRNKPKHKSPIANLKNVVVDEDEDDIKIPAGRDDGMGTKMLAPYSLKMVISLLNGHEVVYDNPEKHAQATLTEAVDAAMDGARNLLRAEKEKEIKIWRQKKEAGTDVLAVDDEDLGPEQDDSLMEDRADAAMEEFYEKVEAELEEKARTPVKDPPPAPASAPVAAAAPAATTSQKDDDLRNFLL